MRAGVVNYLRRELIVPTTAATGRRAGTNVAATGRTLLTTGRAFLIAGMAFLVNQLFWSGAAEEKVRGVFISKTGYTIPVYYYFISYPTLGTQRIPECDNRQNTQHEPNMIIHLHRAIYLQPRLRFFAGFQMKHHPIALR